MVVFLFWFSISPHFRSHYEITSILILTSVRLLFWPTKDIDTFNSMSLSNSSSLPLHGERIMRKEEPKYKKGNGWEMSLNKGEYQWEEDDEN